MTKKAWIENAVIRDICPGNPQDLYHPDVAVFYNTDVPDDAANGDGWVDGQLVKPVIPDPVPVEPPAPVVVPPKVSAIEYKMLFTPQERIATKNSPDPIIQDLHELLNDPRVMVVDLSLASIQGALDYMTSLGILAEGRKAEILTGVPS
jgi:hypothetical protein